jgi:hypothetical protein
MEYQRDEHRVHWIVSHLIWRPKRRQSVLVGPRAARGGARRRAAASCRELPRVAASCRELSEGKGAERGWSLLESPGVSWSLLALSASGRSPRAVIPPVPPS